MSQLCTVEDRWIATPNGRLFARVWGSGLSPTPIVLLHDSLGCVALWRRFPERLCLATGRTVIAYDRLGFGQSDPFQGEWTDDFIRTEAEDAFPRLREQLGLEAFIAFGHSVGGGMAAHCAAAFPSACRALITESAQAFVEERTREGILEAQAGFRQPGQMARLEKYHGDKAHWVLGAWTETWLSGAFRSWRLAADLPPVRCPALVMHGAEDEYGSVLQPEAIAAALEGPVRLEILPGLRHIPHREDEETVIGLVERFLAAV